jgi:hypothetical protein
MVLRSATAPLDRNPREPRRAEMGREEGLCVRVVVRRLEYAVRSLLKTVRAATPIGSLPKLQAASRRALETKGRSSLALLGRVLEYIASRRSFAME